MNTTELHLGRGSRVACAALLTALVGCTDREWPAAVDEKTGQVAEALISPGAQNIPVAFTTNHEISVTYVKGAGGPAGGSAQGRWVAAANNLESIATYTFWGWMYSDDANANSWT